MRGKVRSWVSVGCVAAATLFAADARAQGAATPARRAHKPRVEAGLAGMIGVGFWGDRAAATFGGPRLVLSYGDFSGGFSFFPSLVYAKYTEHEVRPMLGFGPELTIKRIVFFTPYYFLGDRVRPLIGLGWKF